MCVSHIHGLATPAPYWSLQRTKLTPASGLHGFPIRELETTQTWGTWLARSVKHPTLDFGSGHDLTVCRIEPHVRLHTDSACLAFSLSLPTHTCCLSKSINKLKKKTHKCITTEFWGSEAPHGSHRAEVHVRQDCVAFWRFWEESVSLPLKLLETTAFLRLWPLLHLQTPHLLDLSSIVKPFSVAANVSLP